MTDSKKIKKARRRSIKITPTEARDAILEFHEHPMQVCEFMPADGSKPILGRLVRLVRMNVETTTIE